MYIRERRFKVLQKGLGQYITSNSEDDHYKDIKCFDVCFSENDRNYIGISLDEDIGDHIFGLMDN